jgi:hypothetical protein
VGTLYADTNGCDPDCLYCRKVLARSKATGIIVTSAEKEDSSSARICKLEALLAQAVDVLDEYAYGFTVLRADIRRALGEDPE